MYIKLLNSNHPAKLWLHKHSLLLNITEEAKHKLLVYHSYLHISYNYTLLSVTLRALLFGVTLSSELFFLFCLLFMKSCMFSPADCKFSFNISTCVYSVGTSNSTKRKPSTPHKLPQIMPIILAPSASTGGFASFTIVISVRFNT